MRDSFEFMSEQSSRENFVEQNPQDAVKPGTASQPSDDQASTVPGQYAHPGAANQTEASIAVTTAYPKFPFRWLYGAVCAPGSLIPRISVPWVVRGTYRVHAGEPGDVCVGSI